MFFLQSNSRRNGCQVRLCGQAKKKVRGGFNLQELAGKAPETTVYQPGKGKQADPVCKETLLPVFVVAGQDGLDVVLINGKMAIQESRKSGMPFLAGQDGNGIGEKDLGIGDDAGKEDGMGRSTMGAFDPTYAQPELGVTDFDGTQIGPMPDQTGGMAAGTGKLVELDGFDYFIIKILRKGVVKFVSNGYHNRCPCGESRRWLWAGTKLWSVGFLPVLMLQKHMIPQKPQAANKVMENTSNFFVPGVFLF